MSDNNNSPNNTIASQNPRNLEMILFSFKVELKYTWCMWTQGLEYTWCMWTQWLEYTLPMLFFIFVRLLRQCTPSCSLLKYTYTKLSQLQPWAPAAATSAESTKCLHSRSTYFAGTHAMHTGDDIGGDQHQPIIDSFKAGEVEHLQ